MLALIPIVSCGPHALLCLGLEGPRGRRELGIQLKPEALQATLPKPKGYWGDRGHGGFNGPLIPRFK